MSEHLRAQWRAAINKRDYSPTIMWRGQIVQLREPERTQFLDAWQQGATSVMRDLVLEAVVSNPVDRYEGAGGWWTEFRNEAEMFGRTFNDSWAKKLLYVGMMMGAHLPKDFRSTNNPGGSSWKLGTPLVIEHLLLSLPKPPDVYGPVTWTPLPIHLMETTAAQSRTLYRGLLLGDYSPEQFEAEVKRNPTAFVREHIDTRTLGIHWTWDSNSAYNFATGRDVEGYVPEGDPFGDEDEGGVTVGILMEAEVDAAHVIAEGTQEYEDYSFSDSILGDDHPEHEVVVRDRAPIRITRVEVLAEGEVEWSQVVPMSMVVAAAKEGPVYYHGYGRTDGNRALVGDKEWDSRLFVSHDPEVAKLYGPKVRKVQMAPDTRVLKKDHWMGHGQTAQQIAHDAQGKGYDVVEFHHPHDFVGHVILNPSKIVGGDWR